MLKNFAFITVTGLLASACVIDIGNTISDSATATDSAGTTTEGTTSTGTTTGTTTSDGTTTQSTTTQGTTSTTSPTTGPTTTDATTGTTTDATTGGSNYGQCGWHPDKYYACAGDGGVPGEVDPEGVSPIDCPDTLPAEGEKCDETTPVNFAGCCLPDGTNWYCSGDGMVVMAACGA